jgi:hypothetical protein
MAQQKQNPGWRAGASRNQLSGWLPLSPTASDQQAQMLATHFRLSPSTARAVARHCFGEAAND